MENKITSANTQKLSKLSITSLGSSEYNLENSIEEEKTPKINLNFIENERNSLSFVNVTESQIKKLVTRIALALSSHKISYERSFSLIETLKKLIPIICSEYLQGSQTINELFLNNPQISEEIPVNVLKSSDDDIIGLIFEFSKTGLLLTQKQSKNFSKLLIGAIRDSGSCDLRLKNIELQGKIIKQAKNIEKIQSELKERCKNQKFTKRIRKTKSTQRQIPKNPKKTL